MQKPHGATTGILIAGAVAAIALGSGSASLTAAIARQPTDQPVPHPEQIPGVDQDLPGRPPGLDRGSRPGPVSQYLPVDLPAGAFEQADRDRETILAGPLDRVRDTYDRLGPIAAGLYAQRHGVAWRDAEVMVRIDTGLPMRGMRLRDASNRAIVDGVLADVDDLGGRVRNVVGPHIEAWVPVEALDDLALRPTVRGVRSPWRMREEATSEGRRVIGADLWDGVSFRNPTDGLIVGVIDNGFEDYMDLLGSDLPPTSRVFTRDFTDDADIEGDTAHGTAVAEIIHDVEPDSTMYLARVSTTGDISEAMTWMLDNDVDVINMSLGCAGCGPGDGRGSIIDTVERGPQAGVPFVTSAGNEANRHWMGSFVDADGDGFHEFAPGDETNSFFGAAGEEISIIMNWNFVDWFASAQDFDLLLLDSQLRIIDQSRFRQAGFAGQLAEEEIFITLPFTDTFHIIIERVEADLPETLEIYLDLSGMQYVVSDQSLTVPADGAQVTSVGAVRWSNDQVEFFSSRGPTKDGRTKPDFGAPDGVSTESFGPLGFFGTSAASPHMVGAIALLHGRLGVVTPVEAIEIIRARTLDLPPTGIDNLSGAGRISLLANQD